jgi:hypothetical protein
MDEEATAFTLKVALFKPAGAMLWRSLRRAAERLARAVSASSDVPVRVLRCPPPSSLAGASQNRFHFPLRGVKGEPV